MTTGLTRLLDLYGAAALDQALAQALQKDPLNVALQRRYWAMRSRMRST